MSCWNRNIAIFKSIRAHGNPSVRWIAEQTGLAKSRVHRLSQVMARRNAYPESWFWETEDWTHPYGDWL